MHVSERLEMYYEGPESPKESQGRIDAAFDTLFSEVVMHSVDLRSVGDR